MNIAIIGAGMAGLSCAQALSAAGHRVSLFDKGRGPGGRMSTRRVNTDQGQVSFDHGAQYFTARSPDFREQVDQWHRAGLVAAWPSAGADAWVGAPAMNAPIADMAARQDVLFSCHVMGLVREGASWRINLQGGGKEGPFDAAILAMPAEQAAAFIGAHDLAMAAVAVAAQSAPCWTVLIAYDGRLPCEADVIRSSGPVAWAARNNAKPGRAATECWVVQADEAWSQQHLEDDASSVAEYLATWLDSQSDRHGVPRQTFRAAHRWRFAMTTRSPHGALWNPSLRLGACGDWLLGPRVELAWQSGKILAERIGALGAED